MIQLTCSVHSIAGPLSVLWQLTDKQANEPAQEVASVGQDGIVSYSPTYKKRAAYGEILVEKVRANTFTLSMYNALPGDEGQYECTATEWLQPSAEPEVKERIGEDSATKTITVKTVGRFMRRG